MYRQCTVYARMRRLWPLATTGDANRAALFCDKVEVATIVEDVPDTEAQPAAAAPATGAEPDKKKKKKDKKKKKKGGEEGPAAVPAAAAVADVPVLATSAYRPLNADGSIAITYDTLAGTLDGNQVRLCDEPLATLVPRRAHCGCILTFSCVPFSMLRVHARW